MQFTRVVLAQTLSCHQCCQCPCDSVFTGQRNPELSVGSISSGLTSADLCNLHVVVVSMVGGRKSNGGLFTLIIGSTLNIKKRNHA